MLIFLNIRSFLFQRRGFFLLQLTVEPKGRAQPIAHVRSSVLVNVACAAYKKCVDDASENYSERLRRCKESQVRQTSNNSFESVESELTFAMMNEITTTAAVA